MPIYEYQCDQCGHQFDAIQKYSDAPLESCPSCEKPALRKKISAPSFRLSGSGWYETDFKTDKDKQKNLAGDRAESVSTKDSKSSKDTKTTNQTNVSGTKQPVAASKS